MRKVKAKTKKSNARSIAAEKMWRRIRKRIQKKTTAKTTAKTTTATKDAKAGAPRHAIGMDFAAAEPLTVDYHEMYERVDDELSHARRKLMYEQAVRNSLDRDLETMSHLVRMLANVNRG